MSDEQPPGPFADFRSAVDVPHWQPDPVVLRQLDRRVVDFRLASVALRAAPGFAAAMVDHLAAAFRRLDALPRDEPFWDGTNRRPTQYKLSEFAWSLGRADPTSLESAWLQVGVSTVVNWYFDPIPWERLARAGGLDPRWIVDAALQGAALGSYDTEGPLADLLGRLGLCAAVADHLETVRSAAPWAGSLFDQYAPVWVAQVQAACDRGG